MRTVMVIYWLEGRKLGEGIWLVIGIGYIMADLISYNIFISLSPNRFMNRSFANVNVILLKSSHLLISP